MNRHLSDKAKRTKLVEPHLALAKKINNLSNPSRERVERLVDLIIDLEIKAGWKRRKDTGDEEFDF